MGLAHAFAPIDAAYRAEVLADTWGHLAPSKNRVYKGYILFAVGCFGNDPLNPTVLEYELNNRTLGSLDSSPWFFSALQDFLSDLETETGKVYRFDGTFRNYEFDGKVRQLQCEINAFSFLFITYVV